MTSNDAIKFLAKKETYIFLYIYTLFTSITYYYYRRRSGKCYHQGQFFLLDDIVRNLDNDFVWIFLEEKWMIRTLMLYPKKTQWAVSKKKTNFYYYCFIYIITIIKTRSFFAVYT